MIYTNCIFVGARSDHDAVSELVGLVISLVEVCLGPLLHPVEDATDDGNHNIALVHRVVVHCLASFYSEARAEALCSYFAPLCLSFSSTHSESISCLSSHCLAIPATSFYLFVFTATRNSEKREEESLLAQVDLVTDG